MKVLFLDIDGVLNNRRVFLDKRFGYAPIDGLCVQRLHEVVRKTGCKIVLSSSWRDMHHLELKLVAADVWCVYVDSDIPHIFDRVNPRHEDGSTKRLGGEAYVNRGSEIDEWLSRHPEVTRFAIVDDESDMSEGHFPYFVKTDFEYGLTKRNMRALISILNKE